MVRFAVQGAPVSTRPTVIVTYSRADKKTLRRLKVHLATLEDVIDLWVDTSKIPEGDPWYREICRAIDAASIAILLVSPDYLASEVVRNKELPRILERQRDGKLTVLSVFVSPSAVARIGFPVKDPRTGLTHTVTLDQFQGFGEPDRPLSKMPRTERDLVFVALEGRVRELAGGTVGPRGEPELSPVEPPVRRPASPRERRSSPPSAVLPDAAPPVSQPERRRRCPWWPWRPTCPWPWIAGAGAVAALLLWAGSAAYCPREVRCETAILTPEAGATVGASGTVKGSARLPPDGHLWILLHPPVPGNQWWPQEPASVRNDDGTWSAVVYFGNEDDVGAEFEIAAVVVTPGTNASFEQWLKRGRERDDYPSLPFPIGTERVPGCADARRIVKKVSH